MTWFRSDLNPLDVDWYHPISLCCFEFHITYRGFDRIEQDHHPLLPLVCDRSETAKRNRETQSERVLERKKKEKEKRGREKIKKYWLTKFHNLLIVYFRRLLHILHPFYCSCVWTFRTFRSSWHFEFLWGSRAYFLKGGRERVRDREKERVNSSRLKKSIEMRLRLVYFQCAKAEAIRMAFAFGDVTYERPQSYFGMKWMEGAKKKHRFDNYHFGWLMMRNRLLSPVRLWDTFALNCLELTPSKDSASSTMRFPVGSESRASDNADQCESYC